ncbi:MAG: HEPN domain-containing protein [Verrucomicrobia bacterium]|nr:HEPN domain-containing protein [Verrucomicrobiota bacterium]
MPRKTDSNNPADWIYLSELDLEGVRFLAEREVSYAMCRSKLAEVLEKVVKAELIRCGWFLEKTHDLQRLGKELRIRNPDLADHVQPLIASLAEVYFTERYPGFDLDDPNWPVLRDEIKRVNGVLEIVKERIRGNAKPS